jgi:hypothetical protein
MPHQPTFSKTSTVAGTFQKQDRSLRTFSHPQAFIFPSFTLRRQATWRERERGEEREARARHGVRAASPRSSCLSSLACHGHGRYPSLGTEIAGSSPSAALLCFVFYDAFAAPASGTLVSSSHHSS